MMAAPSLRRNVWFLNLSAIALGIAAKQCVQKIFLIPMGWIDVQHLRMAR
jgi:hypothetical protein